MGRLAIRRVVYSGDKYSFESPYLNDGIVIMEGVNGHGKSTFMNLIYYGLGGRVQAFNKNDDNDSKKHNEIFYDTNNYVELLIEIDDEKYAYGETSLNANTKQNIQINCSTGSVEINFK